MDTGNNYGVNRETIAYAEGRMEQRMPEQLRQYFLDVGYGNLFNGTGNENHFFSPEEVADFKLRVGEYSRRSLKYDKWGKDRLYFFRESKDKYYSIGEDGVYLKDKRISRSLVDFVEWIKS